MCIRGPLFAALVLTLAACTISSPPNQTPTLSPSSTSTPVPTSTPTSTLAHTPTPTFVPTPTRTPRPTPTLYLTPTPITSPIRTPISGTGSPGHDVLSTDPPPRPFNYIVVNPETPRQVPNATRAFWLLENTTGERRQIIARLRVQTEHVAMWVQNGTWHDVQKLEEAANSFEKQTYPVIRAAFGSEWTPGVDNDPRIHILHATDLDGDVLSYTSSADEFPRDLYPFSNQAEMITVHVGGQGLEVGSPFYHASLARQFQRMIQWFQDPNEERWVKEGLAELAARMWLNSARGPGELEAGAPEQAYLDLPDTSLTVWEDACLGGGAVAQRGAAYLFAVYFHERFGDEGTRALVAQPLNGAAGFDAVLKEIDAGLGFEDLFAEWLVANYLDLEPQLGGEDPQYGYATLDLERPTPAAIYQDYPVTVTSSVQQFGADYVRLQGEDDLRIRFTGAITIPLLGLIPHSGRHFWWSNRADESLTTLARAFDLSDVEEATLTYWVWYDIEPGYDYATVEISTDAGQQWRMLSTPSGTGDDPRGNNPGWGYTGASGNSPGWVQETVDLSPYAGSEVQVRFSYLTDEALTGPGFALDDIAIPQIGYADDVEGGTGGWRAAGFVRSDDFVPQRYQALLIRLEGSPEEGQEQRALIERLPIEKDHTAEWIVPLESEGWHEVVLVLAGKATLTTQAARYQLTIEQVEK